MSAIRKFPTTLPTVREARFETTNYKQLQLSLNGKPGVLRNISDTGVAFTSDAKYEVNEEGVIEIQVASKYQLKLQGRIIWGRPEDQSFIYGFHFNHQYLPEGFLEAFDQTAAIREELQSEQVSYKTLDPEIVRLTYEIKSFLESAKLKLDALENRILVTGFATKNSYAEVIKSTFEPYFVGKLHTYSKDLDRLFSKVTEKSTRQKHVHFFRSQVGSYYTNNPFIGRALRKPRGYAGDYEMMNQIYQNNFEGNSFFEALMHRYGITESSSKSVMYRRGYFCERIMKLAAGKDRFTFASMASGPAQEVIELLTRIPPEDSAKYHIFLIDQDIEALLNSKRNCNEKILNRNLQCTIHFIPISVKQVLEQAPETMALSEVRFDFIYTAGLYDYLMQPVAVLLTSTLLKWLKNPGGQMIVGNFHPNNPTKTISELVADWKLIHRTEEEMLDLVHGFTKLKHRNLHHDPEGIDLFLEVEL